MGERIRNFLRALFGSRYIAHLEDELLMLRRDFAELRREFTQEVQFWKIRCERYESALIRPEVKCGDLMRPRALTPPASSTVELPQSSWQAHLASWQAQIEAEDEAKAKQASAKIAEKQPA